MDPGFHSALVHLSFPSFGRLSLFGKDYTQEHILMESKETANCLFFLHQENKR